MLAGFTTLLTDYGNPSFLGPVSPINIDPL
jgi:hypothetical protein